MPSRRLAVRRQEVHQFLRLLVGEQFSHDGVHVQNSVRDGLRGENRRVKMPVQFHARTELLEDRAPLRKIFSRGDSHR